ARPEAYERNRFEAQLVVSGLHAADVERALDQREEVAPRRAEPGRIFGSARGLDARIGQHVRIAEDDVQRRPQLVRDGGYELRLEAARLLELLDEPRVRQGQRRDLGDATHDALLFGRERLGARVVAGR